MYFIHKEDNHNTQILLKHDSSLWQQSQSFIMIVWVRVVLKRIVVGDSD